MHISRNIVNGPKSNN